MSQPTFSTVKVEEDFVSIEAFKAVLWTGFVVCLVFCSSRVYIRYMCFHKLLIDDLIMMIALGMILTIVILGHIYLKDVYDLMGVLTGKVMPDATFASIVQRGVRVCGIVLILSHLGIYTIKCNLLLFFRRFGGQNTFYTIFWWTAFTFTIACGAASIGVVNFSCLFTSFKNLADSLMACSSSSAWKHHKNMFLVSCIMDVLSDLVVLCFPFFILWKVSIKLKKKLMLLGIFSLVVFTVAASIVRGTMLGDLSKSFGFDGSGSINLTWIWFWFFVEIVVAFITACLVSFRALFVREEREAGSNSPANRNEVPQGDVRVSDEALFRIGLRRRARQIHDSLLESFRDSESAHDQPMSVLERGKSRSTPLSEANGGMPLQAHDDAAYLNTRV